MWYPKSTTVTPQSRHIHDTDLEHANTQSMDEVPVTIESIKMQNDQPQKEFTGSKKGGGGSKMIEKGATYHIYSIV